MDVKLNHFRDFLYIFKGFSQPKRTLEQYITPDNIIIDLFYYINKNEDGLENKEFADLGSGSGLLSLTGYLFNIKKVYSYELDKKAINDYNINLNILKNEIEEIIDKRFEMINIDITNYDNKYDYKKVDFVISNPPFGNKYFNTDIDLKFILFANIICPKGNIYMIILENRLEVLDKKIKEINRKIEKICSIDYEIKNTEFDKNDFID